METDLGQVGELAQRAVSILSSRMSRHNEAAQLLEEVLGRVEEDPNVFATVANALSSLLHTALGDAAGSEALSRRVLALGDACHNGPIYMAAVHQLALLEKEGL